MDGTVRVQESGDQTTAFTDPLLTLTAEAK